MDDQHFYYNNILTKNLILIDNEKILSMDQQVEDKLTSSTEYQEH